MRTAIDLFFGFRLTSFVLEHNFLKSQQKASGKIEKFRLGFFIYLFPPSA